MLVYRVAKKNRYGRLVGPYRSTGRILATVDLEIQIEEMSDSHMDRDHPVPGDDGLWDIEYYEVCGFSSMSSLRDWFEGWLPLLARAGYFLRVYEVDARYVRHGDHQVVFDDREATLLRTRAIESEVPCNA